MGSRLGLRGDHLGKVSNLQNGPASGNRVKNMTIRAPGQQERQYLLMRRPGQDRVWGADAAGKLGGNAGKLPPNRGRAR